MRAAVARLGALLPNREDWEAARRSPRRDLVAGVTVAVVALPLALAFGVASGLGAAAGLVTAVVAGAVAAVFGGSNVQVSGPTGAMTVVLVPVAQRYGAEGVLMVGLMAGVVLVGLAVARWGRFVRYLPVPVVEGFTAGIAVVIALQQVPAALGVVDVHGERVWAVAAEAVVRFVERPQWVAVGVALGVAVVMLVGGRWRPGWPFSLVAVAVATVLAEVGSWDVVRIGALPAGLPAPSLGFVDLGAVGVMVPAALAVAALAALESLLSATVADQLVAGQRRHDPDRELFGQGLANVAASVFGGVPATAAIARTAVNVRAGAVSKVAALTHAVVLAGIVFVAAPLVGRIPLAALAGVLLATTVRMVQVGALWSLARATRGDAVVLVLTFLVTVVVDLVTAVAVGVGVAVVVALGSVVRSVRVERLPVGSVGVGESVVSEVEERELAGRVVVLRIDGPLLFAAAHDVLSRVAEVARARVVVLRMSRVSALDATGAQVLGEVVGALGERGVTVVLAGVAPGHGRVLDAVGAVDRLRREGLVFADVREALVRARELVSGVPVG